MRKTHSYQKEYYSNQPVMIVAEDQEEDAFDEKHDEIEECIDESVGIGLRPTEGIMTSSLVVDQANMEKKQNQ